jgi:small subunit ribosomal protein S6
MNRKYEALIVLDTKGKEETVDSLVSTISKDMEKAGLKLEQIDNMGKRKFPFNPRHVEAGTLREHPVQRRSHRRGCPALQAAPQRKRLSAAVSQEGGVSRVFARLFETFSKPRDRSVRPGALCCSRLVDERSGLAKMLNMC